MRGRSGIGGMRRDDNREEPIAPNAPMSETTTITRAPIGLKSEEPSAPVTTRMIGIIFRTVDGDEA